MPTPSIGDREPEVTSPPPACAAIAMPCRGIACSIIRKGTSFRSVPRALTSASAAEPMKPVADLEAQRVARAQPARRDAARDDRIPQRRRVVRHARKLHALLARVAG